MDKFESGLRAVFDTSPESHESGERDQDVVCPRCNQTVETRWYQRMLWPYDWGKYYDFHYKQNGRFNSSCGLSNKRI